MDFLSIRRLSSEGLKRFAPFLYEHRILYLVMCIFSALSVFDIVEASIFKIPIGGRVAFTISVAALKATLLMIVLFLLNKNKYGKILAWIIIVCFGCLSIVNFVSHYFYGFGITRKLILIAAQTTPVELINFLPQILGNIALAITSPELWGIIATGGLVVLLVKRIRFKSFIVSLSIISSLGMVAFAYYSFTFTSGRTAVSLTLRIAKYGREVAQWNAKFKELQRHQQPLLFEESVQSCHRAKTVVVVLGESASRSHHSCYGYRLQTTPCIDALSDSIFLYSNAIGSSASTSGNMERILSFKPDDKTYGDGLDYPLLVDVFKKAGYKLFWLSNQERTGSVSNTSGVMVMNADVIKYIGAENSEDALSSKFDEALLPELAYALADTAEYKMIFLHFMGSHTQYYNRYPKHFNIFDASNEMEVAERPYLTRNMSQTVAEYDNSIRYTDYLLGRILKEVANEPMPGIVAYFSDHGENVYDDGPRMGRGERFVEVPFFIYANNTYQSDNPEIIKLLKNSIDRKFSTANFVHQLLTLTGTTYRLYNPTLDVISPDFVERKRLVDEKEWEFE